MDYFDNQPGPGNRGYTARTDAFWAGHPEQLRKAQQPSKPTWKESLEDWWQDFNRSFRRYFGALLFLFNLHVVVLSVAACIAVYLCSQKYWNITCVRVGPLVGAAARSRRAHAACRPCRPTTSAPAAAAASAAGGEWQRTAGR